MSEHPASSIARIRRHAVATLLVLVLVTGATIGMLVPTAAAETTVEVKGVVIKITMTVDVVGAADKHPTAPNGQPLVDYWQQVLNDTWGAAFDQLLYKDCYSLELDVKLTARKSNYDVKDGNYRIIVGAASGGGFEGTGFEGTDDETSRNSRTGDGTRSFEHDRDGAIPEDAPPTVVAHEFGHLMGLGDDRADGKPKKGRDGTMMVGGVPGVDTSVVQRIDQDLINRIGDAIREHLKDQGEELPECEKWEGTFRQAVDGCSGVGEWAIEVGVAKDGSVVGTGTVATEIQCPGGGAPSQSIQLSGSQDSGAFHLTVVPCACGPLDLAITENTAAGSTSVPGSSFMAELTCEKRCDNEAVG